MLQILLCSSGKTLDFAEYQKSKLLQGGFIPICMYGEQARDGPLTGAALAENRFTKV